MKSKIPTIIIFICMISMFSFSCKKFVQIDPAPDMISADAVFTSDKTALSAVNGVYLAMREAGRFITNGGLSIYCGLAADDIRNLNSNPNYDPFYTNNLLPTFTVMQNAFWATAYRNIYRTNAIIEGIDKSTLMSDSVKKQLKGEMKVVRALYYFYMANLFGDVPLVITTDYEKNASLPRTTVTEIYEQIVSDLTDAKDLLKTTYPSANRVRPNRYTATALLARVYLYMKDWANAEAQASIVIDNISTYKLATPTQNGAHMRTIFLIASNETIWQIAPSNESLNTDEGAVFVPSGSSPSFAATTNLLNTFDSGDLRKTRWLRPYGSTYVPYKDTLRTATTPIGEYNIVLRIAEQYLIRAEAKAQRNNLSGAQADLNAIRVRSGLSPNNPPSTQTLMLSAVEKERQVELFAEWGHRWLDLKRTGRIGDVLGPIKGLTSGVPNFEMHDALFPIPQTELDRNPFLTQNPGY